MKQLLMVVFAAVGIVVLSAQAPAAPQATPAATGAPVAPKPVPFDQQDQQDAKVLQAEQGYVQGIASAISVLQKEEDASMADFNRKYQAIIARHPDMVPDFASGVWTPKPKKDGGQ